MISTAVSPRAGLDRRPHDSFGSSFPEKATPLSWEQEQIWLHAKQFPELPLYTETLTILYRGALDIGGLERALYALCQRHEILRAIVEEDNGVPYFVMTEGLSIRVNMFDLAADDVATREQLVQKLLHDFSNQPFALDLGPLLRAFAVRHASDDTRIYLTLHHLLFDGVSLRQVLLPELIALYEACKSQTASHLAAPTMQYADYVAWQRRQATTTTKETAMTFWQANLDDVSPLNLPTDRSPTAQMSREGGVHFFSFDQALTQAVLDAARRHRTTAFTVLLASFIALLSRYADTEEVTLGTVYGGRPETELETVMGCFLNILVLRTDLTGEPNFSQLLARVRGVTLDALENAAAPFQEVVRQILSRSSSAASAGSPLPVIFSFQPPAPALAPEWDLDVFGVFNGCAKFDLHMEVEQRHGIFRGRLMYSAHLYQAATIQSMVQHWFNLLHAATLEPERPIWNLPLLNLEEQKWLLHGVNPAPTAVPKLCVHELFAQRAAEAPASLAVRFGGKDLTYRELARWSESIANRLYERGLSDGSVVALMVERSPAMLAGLLGILRAGAAYVPLDPTYPEARLEYMMRASGASLLLTQNHLIPNLPAEHPTVLDIATLLTEQQQAEDDATLPLPAVDSAATAYILFTSGSTGLPKGVEVPHSALTNLLWSMLHKPGIEPQDRLLAVTSISFDIAALELFLPLIVGARVELATKAEMSDPALLAAKLAECGATMMQATPATWRMLINYDWKPTLPLKILCGGEALPLSLAEELLARAGSVWNMYGPTETTIWSSCIQLQAGAATVPLGDPVMNTGLYVLDSRQMLVPAAVPGELYIGGAGLAKGYCWQPDLTEDRFPEISLVAGKSSRLYRTGDRVKRLGDGSLQFLGRTDKQVKLHGFRIELGEIEHVLNSLPGVREGAVVLASHPTRGEMLAAYVIPKSGASLSSEELRASLSKYLPTAMLPSVIRILAEAPQTLNGKLDRSSLPSIEDEAHKEITAFEPPQLGIEQTLAGIWRDVLDLKSVSRGDNFFDLGGHSLEAVRSLSLANRQFGTAVSFAAFIQGPTIAQLARVIQGESVPRVQLLKRGSSETKRLLWIGAEPWLTRFVSHLSNDVTVYAITPDAEQLADRSIQAMAAQILPDIRKLQAEGQYVLGGFCLRSLLAFEIARRLKDEGGEVGLLVLGDLYAPGLRPRWSRRQRIMRRIHRESWNLYNILRSPSGQKLRELRWLVSSWRRLLSQNVDSKDTSDELLQALYSAELNYKLAPFPGQVLFLESGESQLLGGSTARTWDGFIGEAEVYCYTGLHENLLNDSYLGAFAQKIEDAMSRAIANNAAPQPIAVAGSSAR